MNSFPVMDWNSKWDWENLDMFSSKASGSPKKLQVTYWGIEEGDIDNGSFNLSGGGGGSGGSASDVGHGSSAKSSISASTDCSSKDGMKTSNFTFETVGGFPGYFSNKNELAKPERLSPPMEASVGSGEQLIGLKLGKRTYFENSGAKTASLSTVPLSSASTAKKTKSSSQCGPMPRCQVEGCNLDLSSAKEYHRKHRVCESHSKSSKVVVGGQERRFCQQCSRFHSLSEFDEKKRSCRRRLSDHNARRRKPQQETIQFNSTKLSSSFYEGRQQMSFVLNNAPHAHTRPTANLSWESANPKFALTKGYLLKPEKGGVIDGHPHLPGIQLPHALSMSSHDSNKLSQCKGTTTEAFDQGFKESMFSSSLDAAPDLRRALSLLSTNSWGQLEPESATLQHPTHINHTNMPQHVLPVTSHTSSHYWPADQQSSGPHMHVLAANSNGNSHYQEIQLFKSPYETSFYSNPLN